ncbi:MAG: acyl-CoA thioesterase [Bacteroidota bacterium]
MQKVKFDLEVYTYQIDFVHHLSNIVYIEWMEIGRLKLLDAMGLPAAELEKSGIFPVLTKTEIAYKQPIFYGDSVEAEVWISKLNLASAIIEFRFFKNERILAAEGRQKGLFINGETQKPYRLTEEQRNKFNKHVIEEN